MAQLLRMWLAVVMVVGLIAGCAPDEGDGEEGAAGPTPGEAEEGTEEPAADDDADDGDDDAAGDGEPITIGFLGELSGPFAIWGIPARNGMRMAVQEINDDGGVNGRQLELVERDTQGTPDEGVTALRGMIDRDGILAAGGLVSSDVALAASRAAEEDEVPLFLVKAGSDAILTQDSRYTFRTCLPAAPMNMGPIANFIEDEGLTRVGAIIADYAWGQAIREAIEERIATLDGVELQIEVAPVGETDFTTYLRRLQEFDPEIIIATGHPPGAGPITRQSADLGMEAYVTGPNAPAGAVMEGVGDAAFDRYVDFSCADYESDEYQELATRYNEEFGDFMEDDAVVGYGMVQMVAEAVENGAETPADIAEYLRGNSFDLPGHAWSMDWTEWGEFADAAPLLVIMREQDPPEGVNPGANWWPEVLFRTDPIDPFEPGQ